MSKVYTRCVYLVCVYQVCVCTRCVCTQCVYQVCICVFNRCVYQVCVYQMYVCVPGVQQVFRAGGYLDDGMSSRSRPDGPPAALRLVVGAVEGPGPPDQLQLHGAPGAGQGPVQRGWGGGAGDTER